MRVYSAIAAVQADLAKVGISKERTNDQQHYKFRGIDDVYGALAPLLSKHGLCFLPRVISRQSEERQTAQGRPLFYVTVECEFDLVAAEDGTRHTVKTFGEAMDSADKATNKAMSAAYKYAAFQTFCIPCEGEDADATTHDVRPGQTAPIPTTIQPQQGTWTGENKSGRPFRGTGLPVPQGWFTRVKEDRAKAVEEIGGQRFGVEKNPAGKWEVVEFIDPPKSESKPEFDANDDVPF